MQLIHYLENQGIKFHDASLSIIYQPSEQTMMIDVAAIESLELLQNIKNVRQDCLYGVLRKTSTAMGTRLLRNTILQPSTMIDSVVNPRLDAVEELKKEHEIFDAVRRRGY